MDIQCRSRYRMGHETPWNPPAAPDAKRAGHRPASGRQDLSLHSRDPECFNKFGGALGSSPSHGWLESAPAQAGSWASADADTATEAPLVAVTGKGFSVRRIYDRPVDPAAHRQADRETFRDTLSSRPCVAGDAGLGLDVSEAGAAGSATGRDSHRALEDTRLAAYKKKPEHVGPISSSSTKADSSSSLTSAGLGRRSEIPRCSNTAIDGIAFPSSPVSPCPHPEPRAVLSLPHDQHHRRGGHQILAPPSAASAWTGGTPVGRRHHSQARHRPRLPAQAHTASRPSVPVLRPGTQPGRVCLDQGQARALQWCATRHHPAWDAAAPFYPPHSRVPAVAVVLYPRVRSAVATCLEISIIYTRVNKRRILALQKAS